jgi:tetratricopeptide (TPR) repeat protein
MRKFPRLIVHTKLLLLTLLVSVSLLAQNISGKYILVKDSDGKTPKGGAEISITFSPGKFSLKAAMPGQTVTDNGTWKVTGSTMTISFKEMEQGTKTGSYSLSNGTLTLPFMMLTNGKGSSTWQLAGTAFTPTGTVNEVIIRNRDGVQKIMKYKDKVDAWATADAKKYNGGLAEAYYVMGNLFYFKKLRPEAVYAFAKAAELKPTNALYLNNLSSLIMDYNKYSDAVILLKEVTRNFPNLSSSWGNLALAQLKMGNYPAADSAIRVARRLDPENGLFCYTDGKIKEKKGDKAGADNDFGDAWDKGYAGEGREGAKNASVAKKPTPPKKPTKTKGEEQKDKLAQWEGHYEANAVSARSGETAKEANTTFGKDLAQTTINLQTLSCAKEFSMDISRMGNITGSGKVMYVYQGSAGGPVTGMAPAPIAAMYGGFGTNLKDGFQIRDWSFTGTVDEEGNVEISGVPSGELDLFNTGKWQKIKTWSPLPPDAAGAAMKGPFHMKIVNDEKMGPVIKVDQWLELGDKLIRRVHYRAYIYRSDADVTPDCKTLGADPQAKCPASEFIKTKVSFNPRENISIEQSTTYAPGQTAQQEMAVNVVAEHDFGPLTGEAEFHQDGSYEFSIGFGVDTEDLTHGGPFKFGEKLQLIYDSKCGWGVKASAGVELESIGTKTGASVEGVIFFNKGL